MNLYQIDHSNRYLLVAALTARNAANIIRDKTDDDHPLHGVNICPCELEIISDAYYPQSKEMIVTSEVIDNDRV